MTLSPVTALNTTNAKIQVSSAPKDSTIGLLVERGPLFCGVLLTPSESEELARVLLMRARHCQVDGKADASP